MTAIDTDTGPVAPVGVQGQLWLASWTLWRREMVRFFRQRNRVIGAFATPVVFWLLLGFGLNKSFTPGAAGGIAGGADQSQVSYLAYFYPGTLVLILLFTAIFSTISVIEDRREGFLQAVLVAPVPRLAIVLGKVLGGASIATIQGLVFLLAWPVIGGWPGWGMMAAAVAVMFVLGMGLTSLGLCLAWPMDSTAGFHAVMNLLLMPMWFLSGAVFPLDSAPWLMRAMMWANPLTYGQAAMSSLLQGQSRSLSAPVPAWVALIVLVVFTGGAIWLSERMVNRVKSSGSL